MSFHIIVKNSSRGFKPHFNREFCDRANPNGKMVHTKEDYVKEMKSRGLEPYDPNSIRKSEKKPYKPSKWAREITNQVQNHGVSGTVIKEINEKLNHKPRKIKPDGKGNFS